MKKVKGPTDHVVIVGAGLAGLSAALRLAGAGRKVTVVERESFPGGRNGLLNKSGYAFDTGPTVLTMPDLIADAFRCVGEEMRDWLDLIPLNPLYRAFYADGTQLDVHADTQRMETEIAKTISAEEAMGYRRYVDFVTKLYKYEMNDFIDRNIDSPLNLLTPNLARLIALGGFRKLAPKVSQFLERSAHSEGLLVPSDVCRSKSTTSAGNLCSDCIYGFSQWCVFSKRWHACLATRTCSRSRKTWRNF